ncbi:MAG: hypothetical protein QM528_07775 [Phycisphaerales bacterium]|nr:hypothetical protein [Phycisphaerales bacterium]
MENTKSVGCALKRAEVKKIAGGYPKNNCQDGGDYCCCMPGQLGRPKQWYCCPYLCSYEPNSVVGDNCQLDSSYRCTNIGACA